MRNAAAGRREVLPRHVLENDHQVLRIETRWRQALDDAREHLFLELDAAADAKKDLHQHKVIGAPRAHVGEAWIELKVLFIQLDDALKAVVRMGTDLDQRGVNGIEEPCLELSGL